MTAALPPVAVLAGGLARRMFPETEHLPKCLLDVGGEPFLVHQLRLLRARGITRVVLCVGHLGERVRAEVERRRWPGLDVELAFDGPEPLGTAGPLAAAADRLGTRFFVLYGDSYLPCDYAAVDAAHRASGKRALMTVYRNEGRWDESNVALEAGRIVRYAKGANDPRMLHIDYGLGVMEASVVRDLPRDRATDLAEVYRGLLEADDLAGCEMPERFYEIGSFDGLEELRRLLASSGSREDAQVGGIQ